MMANDSAHGDAKRDGVSVTINQLHIQGFVSDLGVANFLGVSYAEIPARFRQAKPIDPRQIRGIVDATRYGPRCHQPADGPRENRAYLYEGVSTSSAQPMSEFQCLRLNVYAPLQATKASTKLPVLVWIHGGGWTIGDGNSEYDGNPLVQHSVKLGKPIIYVGLNYRLGYYGFLTSKELEAEALRCGETHHPNQGLYDQRLGLLWVQKYIHYFGGDGYNVTIAGESAGGWSVWAHLRSNVPVCQRGVIMSCPAWEFPDPNETQKAFDNLVAFTGVPVTAPDVDKLAALRDLTPSQMEEALGGVYVQPSWDSEWFVYQDRTTPFKSINRFPSWVQGVVAGATRDEAVLFGLVRWRSWSVDQIHAALSSVIPSAEYVQDIIDEYGLDRGSQEALFENLSRFVTDSTFAYAPFHMATEASPPLSIYRFDQVDTFHGSIYKGYAYHSLDSVFFCRLPAVAGPQALATLRATSDAFSQAWIDFTYGRQPWEPYRLGNKVMCFNGSESGTVEWTPEERYRKLTSTEERARMFRTAGTALVRLRKQPSWVLKQGHYVTS